MLWPHGMLLVVDVFVWFEGLLVFPLVFSFPSSVFLKTSHFFLLLLHLFAFHRFLTSALFLSFSTFGVSLLSKLEFLSLRLWGTIFFPFPSSFYSNICLPFLFCLRMEIRTLFLFGFMFENSEVRQHCPSFSFLFARLGASLGSFYTHCPPIEGFVSRDNSLGFVLADLFPLLHQSVNWSEKLVSGRGVMSEVRSSELETGLSSSDDPIEAEVDTAASSWREIRAFHALREECALDTNNLFRFRDRFQFPKGVRVRLPREGEKACHFSPGEVCFYKAAFQCGLRFPVHPFIMELLYHSTLLLGNLCRTHGG